MSRIVDELLFLSRADLGEIKVKRSPVQLDDLIREIQQQASILGQDRQVKTIVNKVEPIMVNGDDLRLRELFLNLVDNAIKYSHPGNTVEMSLVHQDDKGQFTIKDQGIGISSEDLPRIFDRFYRTDSARSHATKGTGLGLSICKWIVESHYGSIGVQSAPNIGSSFTVLLPLAPSPI